MRFSARAFQTFWDLHAWAGVVAGLLLHVMFLTGGLSLYRRSLELWQEPELHAARPVAAGEVQARVDALLRDAGTEGAAREDFWVVFPERAPALAYVTYHDERTDAWPSVYLAQAERGEGEGPRSVPRRGGLADFVFHLHYLQHEAAPVLYYVAGFLGLAMVFAVVTGVLIHLHNFVRQFHQFRPAAPRRVVASDLHKVLGVMGLPFQLVYAFTGSLIILGPYVVDAFSLVGGERAHAAIHAAENHGPGWPKAPKGERTPGGPRLPLDALIARARSAVPGLEPELVTVRGRGRVDGFLSASGRVEGQPFGNAIVWVREDGEVMQRRLAGGGGAYNTLVTWLERLHYARFDRDVARAALVPLSWAACLTLLTGNWIWLARRARRRGTRGYRALERLTVGAGGGVFVAVAALFVADRALPMDWARRSAGAELVFLAVFVLSVLWALVARDVVGMWWKLLAAAAAGLAAVPVLASRWTFAGLLGRGPNLPAVVSVDVALFGTAAALASLAFVVRRASRRAPELTGGTSAHETPLPEEEARHG